jgi:hypothetical protein
MIESLSGNNIQRALEDSLAFINLRIHPVNGEAHLRLAVKHLPESWHHSPISRK